MNSELAIPLIYIRGMAQKGELNLTCMYTQ